MSSVSNEPELYTVESCDLSTTEPVEFRIVDWLKEENIVMTSSTDKMQAFFRQKREKIAEIRRKSALLDEKHGAMNDYAKRKSLFLKVF